ncbi:hypothetical protein BGX31_007635 [Mortierella sp. GBA43]|nr:hypothetical protein BGX31_007635 [Mortierella sp. GBA43]
MTGTTIHYSTNKDGTSSHRVRIYIRVLGISELDLPVPSEHTMVSVRIDTGHEQVDTDYVPLGDLDMLFNQEFCLPVYEDLTLIVTLHLMQAPHLVPRFVPSPLLPHEMSLDVEYKPTPTAAPKWSPFTNGKKALNREMKNMFPSLLTRRNGRHTTIRENLSSSGYDTYTDMAMPPVDHAGSRLVFRSGSGSTTEVSSEFWSPRLDSPSPNTSMSSLGSTGHGLFSKWKKGIQSKRKKTRGVGAEERYSLGRTDGDMQYRMPRSLARVSKLSLRRLRESETALELVQRHINFDDEYCIARTGIPFDTIRSSCENQVVTVEFHAVNTWIDRNDYSRMTATTMDPQCFTRASGDTSNDEDNDEDDDDNSSGDGSDSFSTVEPVIAKVVTTLCFVPGPVMDPESAIYGDEDYVHTEPQSLADCQVGLTYFEWQDTLFFQGNLFYLTERRHWKEAWFCIVGSKLWQCRGVPQSANTHTVTEKQRFINLESVRYIETGTQIFKAAAAAASARYREGGDKRATLASSSRMDDRIDDFEELLPVKNSFRLRMQVLEPSKRSGKDKNDDKVSACAWKTMTLDFYTSSEELTYFGKLVGTIEFRLWGKDQIR